MTLRKSCGNCYERQEDHDGTEYCHITQKEVDRIYIACPEWKPCWEEKDEEIQTLDREVDKDKEGNK